MNHTDFGQWRVTHDDLRIYHALQNCTLELSDYSDPQKMVETVANIGAEDWATSKTVDELIEALEFAVSLMEKTHGASTDEKADAAKLRNALKMR